MIKKIKINPVIDASATVQANVVKVTTTIEFEQNYERVSDLANAMTFDINKECVNIGTVIAKPKENHSEENYEKETTVTFIELDSDIQKTTFEVTDEVDNGQGNPETEKGKCDHDWTKDN